MTLEPAGPEQQKTPPWRGSVVGLVHPALSRLAGRTIAILTSLESSSTARPLEEREDCLVVCSVLDKPEDGHVVHTSQHRHKILQLRSVDLQHPQVDGSSAL
jgi:hypothetical protein